MPGSSHSCSYPDDYSSRDQLSFDCPSSPRLMRKRKERKYVCDKCQKRFSFVQVRPDTLLQLTTNSGIVGTTRYVHPCPKCGQRFTKSFNMRRHLKKCGNSNLREICPVCNKSFVSIYGLEQHMSIAHAVVGEILGLYSLGFGQQNQSSPMTRYIHGCPLCGRRFTTRGNMTRHLKLKKCNLADRVNSNSCQLCEKSFITSDSLKTHMAIAHPQTSDGALPDKLSESSNN
ncbi:hypothetical protein RRG08_048811 [Elysia crispata]|uniref:C2H2-type domain-containing protein n=1 Tax=Elysia crispata TaxID=231223 RepID=A0AAE1E9G0_9GAST|nr:hypothetical protein RRG08_048811 [Elysia crispata]